MPDGFSHFMSDADALMWHIERDPELRSTIVAAFVLERAPDWDALLERIERGSRLIPRLRQRVVEPAMRLGPPAWSEDPNFDLGYHMRRIEAPTPATFDGVLDVASRQAMSGFDPTRPLWEFTLVEGLPDGRAGLVTKVHHSMTDGVGAMKLLLMLVDVDPGGPAHGPDPAPIRLPHYSSLSAAAASVAEQTRGFVHGAWDMAGTFRRAAERLREHPGKTVEDGARAVGSILRFLAPAPHPESSLLRGRGLGRRVTTFDVPLDDIKRAAKAVGGSVNDVFVAGIAGGLRRYHQERGVDVDELRMVMPINTRAEGSSVLGGNSFTPARLSVPVGISDPADRVRAVGVRARALRNEPAVALTDPLAGVLNRMPRSMATLMFGGMLKGTDFVASNVPGVPFPVYMNGAQVERVYAFGPCSGSAANITLISHCGTSCIGITVDTAAVPDPVAFTHSLRLGMLEVVELG